MKRIKFLAVLLSLFLLTGCGFTIRVVNDDRPEADVILVQTDDVPAELLDAREIKVRYVDDKTGKYVVTAKPYPGYFLISPSLYKKLIKSALKNKEEDNK